MAEDRRGGEYQDRLNQLPRRCSASIAPPATSPQNAPLMPSNARPEAVTTKVITAASRCSGTATAPRMRAAEGAQQRQPGHRLDQHRRRRADEGGRRPGQQPEHHIDATGDDRRPPAPRRVRLRIRAGAERRGDGGEIDRMGAERRAEQAEQAGHGEQRPRRRPVAVDVQHRHAGDVLRRHGHDEQRQGDADGRRQGEGRRHPDRHRPGRRERCRAAARRSWRSARRPPAPPPAPPAAG